MAYNLAEPHLSMKSDVDEAESVKSEVVKKEDDDKGDDIDTKSFKDLIKKTVQLDGKWRNRLLGVDSSKCCGFDVMVCKQLQIMILVGLNRYVTVQNLNIFFHATLRN